ncbi:universal stress protein [Aurantibacter crassamenti]|uniref:universal stress protein n=1 Tax=Aurantibacter crassamenti TaxID=1837375 RepID=UPI001939A9B3|nr:universal stress protein [Aurantibacter crassamenti]MBM1104963.1 universal stress protein [Aurantibacter crassamenti]
MKNNKYKIVIFTDLKDSVNTTLISAINFAKMVNGEIEIFHIKKAIDIVKKESQLSAIRNLNSEYVGAEKKIKSIVKQYSKDFNIPLTYSFAIGNIKSEISSYIDEKKPDIIVLGKKKYKILNRVKLNLIQFILKKHNGPIFITDNEKVLELNHDLSFGLIDELEPYTNLNFAKEVLQNSKKPIKSFKIIEKSNTTIESNTKHSKDAIEYVFENNDTSIQNISNYISKSNINLLCVNRGENKNNKMSKNISTPKNINDILSNINVPVLLMGQ